MKSKAMAVLAAVMMIGIAFGAMSVQTDAATTKDLGDVTVSDTVTMKKLAFTTNEGEFKGYKYTVKFYATGYNGTDDPSELTTYGPEVGTTTVGTVGADPVYAAGTSKVIPDTDSTFKVSVEYGNKVGTYLMVVERTDQITTQPVALKAEITVDLGLSANNPVYSTYYKVTVKDGSTATMTLADMNDVQGGVFYSNQVTPTPSINVSEYKWYAYNLPKGLSMSDSGWVSGIYTGNVDVTAQEAKVVAVGATNTYQGILKVTCTKYEGPAALTVKVKDTAAGTPEISNDTSVARVVGADMKFTVEVNGTSAGDKVTIDVVAVDDAGKVTKLTDDGGVYTVSTKGTGAYKVIVTASDGIREATSWFYLYVLPSYGDVAAEIIPGST